jgi:hypothetical protein
MPTDEQVKPCPVDSRSELLTVPQRDFALALGELLAGAWDRDSSDEGRNREGLDRRSP